MTRPVRVRTHDVAILTFTTPSKGKVGKHAPVTVEIGNTRYPESVQVDLYRVTTQGDVLVGTSVQTVGVMKPKSTVSFSFGYAFTNEDAEIGKLPFKAVASIQGARDSVPGDNMVTSPPTLIAR